MAPSSDIIGAPELRDGRASVMWTPTTVGEHEVSAFYTGFNAGEEAWTSSYVAVKVTVVNAINTGSACLPLPL